MLFTAFIFALLVLGAAPTASLRNGDICKEYDSEPPWTCKPPKDCPSALRMIRRGDRLEHCDFDGVHPIVCCDPREEKTVPAGSKTKEMCKKYAESVYTILPDPAGTGEIHLDTCTIVEPHIINGANAEPREYPHMALIGYFEELRCGGSLISDRFVLSAAQCARGDLPMWVKLGEYYQQSNEDDDKGLSLAVKYEVIEMFIHPDYKKPSVYNDIALFKLKTKVDFNEYIRPACLQTEYGFNQSYAIATGWGWTENGGPMSDVLQKVNITILPTEQCNYTYAAGDGGRPADWIVPEKIICAGDIENGRDTCNGDGGGPLQIPLKEPYCMYSLIGITSSGDTRCAIKPSVYTRVSHYVPWIESIVWP